MLDFIYQYGWIACIVAVIIFLTYLYHKRHGTDKTLELYREIAYKLMLIAEKRFLSGDSKRDYVVNQLYVLLPETIAYLITKDDLKDWIQRLYDDFIMDFLDDGHLNDSNIL